MGHTGTTRRHALVVTGALAAGALTGCADGPSGGRDGDGPRTGGASGTTTAAARRALAGASGALRDQYDAVIAAHPALAGRLTPLRSSVAAHVTALGGTARTAGPGGTGRVPAEPAAALRALAAAERRVSDAHTTALADAEPELARLLASVAAAGAVHAYLLAEPGAGPANGGAR
ncbi:hypothetical protein ACIBCM_29165 [Streptomyces sp. NPDC051018]|uniref:hypothetical protein n=1 Tax=Streptomyces sp. NPDC051018 TaxID=3365639 RepID=UPI00378A6F67